MAGNRRRPHRNKEGHPRLARSLRRYFQRWSRHCCGRASLSSLRQHLLVACSKGDNDRWSGRYELDRLLPYLYTIEAWLDRYASWADETRKKIVAERDVTIETIEGLQLMESVRQTCDDERLREFAARFEALEKGSRAQAELVLEDRPSH
jgi:Domain of unknown function (DUF3416)